MSCSVPETTRLVAAMAPAYSYQRWPTPWCGLVTDARHAQCRNHGGVVWSAAYSLFQFLSGGVAKKYGSKLPSAGYGTSSGQLPAHPNIFDKQAMASMLATWGARMLLVALEPTATF